MGVAGGTHSVSRKPKRRGGPLIAKAALGGDRFLSMERNTNNQSEVSLLKLPNIKQSRDYGGLNEMSSLNYTEEKKAKLRAKLEQLYSAKMTVPKSKHVTNFNSADILSQGGV